jgi:hypothetical protein
MLTSLFGGDASGGIVDEKHFEEIQSRFVEVGAENLVRISLPFGERGLEVGETCLVADTGPFLIVGCT